MQNEVILCDQQTLYALGCGSLINDHPQFNGYRIVGDLKELDHLLFKEQAQKEDAKVLVLDSRMLQFTHPHKIKAIQLLQKAIPVMILYNDEDDLQLYNLIEYGFSVIVSRNVSKEEWVKALHMTTSDKVYFCTIVAEKVFALVNQMDKIKQMEAMQNLTIYDKYILVRICEEASSKQIAYEVGHSKRTIEGHRTKLMQQFEVKNLAGLVKITFLTKLYDHYLTHPGMYDVAKCKNPLSS